MRIAFAAALLCLPIFALADNRQELKDQVAAYKKAGEPIEPADFVAKPVEATDNAAIPLREAGKIFDQRSPAFDAYDKLYYIGLPLTDDEAAKIAAAAEERKKAFDLIDDAMSRPGIDWQSKIASPVIGVLLPDLHYLRALANFTGHRALLEHQQGDDAAAIEDIRRMMFLSRVSGKMIAVVSHLVSDGIMQMATTRIEDLAPDLRIGNGPQDVSAKDVAALIAALLDDTSQSEGLRFSLLSERMSQYDTAQCTIDGKFDEIKKLLGNNTKRVVMGPIDPETAAGDGLIMIRYQTAFTALAMGATNFQSLKSKIPPLPRELQQKENHVLLALFMPNLQNAVRSDFRMTAERRMAATAVAIRWYAVDHAGKRSAKLEELVPKYLPAVPSDPMAENAPLKYKCDAKECLVYSTGDDGRDDMGTWRTGLNKPRQPMARWMAYDAVMHLDRQPRPPAKDPAANAPKP